MQSLNFEILRPSWPDLAELGAFAECYAYSDPASALVKMRLFIERMVDGLYYRDRLPKPFSATLVDLLNNDVFRAAVPPTVLNKLHFVRKQGNKAAHGQPATPQTAIELLRECFDLGRWFHIAIGDGRPSDWIAFRQPPNDGEPTSVLQKERRATLERLALQEAQMQVLLTTLDDQRQKSVQAQQKTEALQHEIEAIQAAGQLAADELRFDEATTRKRLIDIGLHDANWNIAADGSDTEDVAQEYEVDGQPTESGKGRVDYVLWDDDGKPLAVVEAKRTSESPEKGRKQASLYADALQKKFSQRPVIFYTNGFETWLWDDVQGYPPRAVFGYYSKDSLRYLLHQRSAKKGLANAQVNLAIVERLYQLEAIKRVTERFEGKHRKALIVQATGSGKTRVAIALTDLLIKTGWVKRVLFLCDRRELRKQARNAFKEYIDEPMTVVKASTAKDRNQRIYLATYPAMTKVFQTFDVGFFDLIIADESHRSVYNVYGDLFRYFDCLQLGLTATPVDFLSRNTFDLFDCDGGLPTFNYDLEDAIEDEWLVPPEVYEHTTQFLREGIKYNDLSDEQKRRLEEDGEDPTLLNYEHTQVDKQIFNKDTNRAILRNLMENGIRVGDGQQVGKTIIFARNHNHAMLLRTLFDEMYPQYGGKFCQVIDNYDPRAEQLIDDFKGEGTNDELTVAISVDMLDTGIDVPEVVNLVFAKPVMSKVKFWQMIGRGTRLCKDLFGMGQDKKKFRIFDHWKNFEFFELRYRAAEPVQSKGIAQRVFEARLDLAEEALNRAQIDVFENVVELIRKDINDLPEDSITVREHWREKRVAAQPETLKRFDPATLALLRGEIAPLMRWRNIWGFTEAYEFDLLVTRMQKERIRASSSFDDLRTELLERVTRLQMHLNPVREKAEVIGQVRGKDFWASPDYDDLEQVRTELRAIMRHQTKDSGGPLPPKLVDIKEDEALIQTVRRETKLKAVDLKAYHTLVEETLTDLFQTDATLQKIHRGDNVSRKDLDRLVSLVLTENPDVDPQVLREFFPKEAGLLLQLFRSIVHLDPKTVDDRFSVFASGTLNARQTQFLRMLKQYISQQGSIELDRLYEDPFSRVADDGPEGIFSQDETDKLINIINSFQPRPNGETRPQ